MILKMFSYTLTVWKAKPGPAGSASSLINCRLAISPLVLNYSLHPSEILSTRSHATLCFIFHLSQLHLHHYEVGSNPGKIVQKTFSGFCDGVWHAI